MPVVSLSGGPVKHSQLCVMSDGSIVILVVIIYMYVQLALLLIHSIDVAIIPESI